MIFSNVAFTAVVSIATLNAVWAATGAYTYKPGGVQENGQFLPGPSQWGGQCNDGSTEQSPIAINTNIAVDPDVHVEDYTFDVSRCDLPILHVQYTPYQYVH